jgi:hypothetical protein
MKLHYILFILLSTYCISGCGQSEKDSLDLEKKYAKDELNIALSAENQQNVLDFKEIIITDSVMATTIAETILFGIYGEANIIKQRPYTIYHINNYWILWGTLPKDMKGGVFQIIIDDRNSQVIKITHGK